jgi:hypothetical protein
MASNPNINGAKLQQGLKDWICQSPIIHGLLSNPFTISILILILISLLDILYGKQYENINTREILQHSSTTLFVVMAGIFLNNLTITKCIIGKGEPMVESRESYKAPRETPIEEHREAPIVGSKYDDILSTYV